MTAKNEQLEIGDQDVPEFSAPLKAELTKGTLLRSESIAALTTALCKASLEFPEISKDTENPYFRSRYTDLATLIKSTRPVLAKHGICLFQFPQTAEAKAIVTTMLTHTSGEWLAFDLALPVTKQDAQGCGSAITYARRYSYQSILNIAGEDDDDGNAAVGKTQKDMQSKATESGAGIINPVQLRSFNSACKIGQKTEAQILSFVGGLGYENAEELPKSELDNAIKWALARQA